MQVYESICQEFNQEHLTESIFVHFLGQVNQFSEDGFQFFCKEYWAILPVYINFPAVQNWKGDPCEDSLQFLRNDKRMRAAWSDQMMKYLAEIQEEGCKIELLPHKINLRFLKCVRIGIQ